jgi:hypothetical protein
MYVEQWIGEPLAVNRHLARFHVEWEPCGHPQKDYKAALELAHKRVIELENKLDTYEFNLSELYKGIFTIDQYNRNFKAPKVAEPSVQSLDASFHQQTNQGQWTGSEGHTDYITEYLRGGTK